MPNYYFFAMFLLFAQIFISQVAALYADLFAFTRAAPVILWPANRVSKVGSGASYPAADTSRGA